MKSLTKNLVILFALLCIFSQFASAEIIFTQATKPVYNIGDDVLIPVTIKSIGETSGIVEMYLLCDAVTINFYRNGIQLNAGQEKSLDSSLVLIKEIIGSTLGTCKIKVVLNEDYALTNEFKISSSINIATDISSKEVDVGQNVIIKAKATKESLEDLEGFVEVYLLDSNGKTKFSQTGTVNAGNINLNLTIPSDLPSGTYILSLSVYEKDSKDVIINKGSSKDEIFIKQKPTSINLIFNKEILPEENLQIESILLDQSGKTINSSAIITLTNSNGEIVDQKEILFGENLSYLIPSQELPADWKISSVSEGVSIEDTVKIKELEKIDVQIVNKTIIISNKGNVLYNKTLLVRIQEEPLNIQVSLKVGESKKYYLSAPTGDYDIKLVTGEGEEISETMSLTGRAIGIKESSNTSLKLFGWIFLILLLLIVTIILFKKLHKKAFSLKRRNKHNNSMSKNNNKDISFKQIQSQKREKETHIMMTAGTLSLPVNQAELSLSIKGAQQDVSVVCLKIKNLKQNESGSPAETINKIRDYAAEGKAATYENQDYLMFIFAPTKTRTLRNEMSALNLANKIQDLLVEHNRKFNQRLDFGISLNNGSIVAKIENGVFKFMAMGLLMTTLKRIASLSNQEILLSQEMNDLLALKVKSTKEMRDGVAVYLLNSVKTENEETTKFINKFLNRQKEY